jgi:hypothetical protein
MQERWQRAREIAREFGPMTVPRLVGHRLLNLLIRFDVLIVVVLDREQVTCPETPDESQLRFEVWRAAEFPRLLDQIDPEIGGRYQLSTFADDALPDDVLLVVRVDSEIAGFTFAHLGGYPTLAPGVCLRAPEGYVYNYSAFTHPEYRGRKHQGRRHYELLNRPECGNCKGLIGYVYYTNLESRRGLPKSGYRPIGHLFHARLGHFGLVWCGWKLLWRGVRLEKGRILSVGRIPDSRQTTIPPPA